MSSNFACEAVQRSGGTFPQYLYSPSPEGLAPTYGNVSFNLGVVIASSTTGQPGVNITTSFEPSPNGIYLIDCVCITPGSTSYSISAVGTCLEQVPGTYVLTGFNQTNVAGVTGSAPVTAVYIAQLSTQNTDGQLTLFQNSGGPLTYDIRVSQISTLRSQ